jgi:general secretion pathway protein J
MKRAAGFTLLEMLVAIGIFAIISGVAYGGLIQVLETRDRVEAEREFWRALTLTFRRLEDDLAQARPREVRDRDGAPLPAFRGQPVDPRALGAPSLEFTRGGVLVIGKAPRSDLQRVAYRLEGGMLQRLTWPVLDRAPQSQPVSSGLIGGIDEMTLRFSTDGQTWSTEWPSRPPAGQAPPAGANATLPRGVEITVRFTERGEFSRLFIIGP